MTEQCYEDSDRYFEHDYSDGGLSVSKKYKTVMPSEFWIVIAGFGEMNIGTCDADNHFEDAMSKFMEFIADNHPAEVIHVKTKNGVSVAFENVTEAFDAERCRRESDGGYYRVGYDFHELLKFDAEGN